MSPNEAKRAGSMDTPRLLRFLMAKAGRESLGSSNSYCFCFLDIFSAVPFPVD